MTQSETILWLDNNKRISPPLNRQKLQKAPYQFPENLCCPSLVWIGRSSAQTGFQTQTIWPIQTKNLFCLTENLSGWGAWNWNYRRNCTTFVHSTKENFPENWASVDLKENDEPRKEAKKDRDEAAKMWGGNLCLLFDQVIITFPSSLGETPFSC